MGSFYARFFCRQAGNREQLPNFPLFFLNFVAFTD
jgi:hypothetical protein